MNVYLVTNMISGKYYVGQTVGSPDTRFMKHVSDSRRDRGTKLGRAIRKYGKNNFQVEILCACPDRESLDEAEKFFIHFMASYKDSFGYNLDKGGQTSKAMADSTKDKIRKSLTGRKRPSQVSSRIGEAHRGKVLSQSHKDNISKALKGKTKGIKRPPRKPESIKQQRDFAASRIPWKYPEPFTDEMRSQMSSSQISRRLKYIREQDRHQLKQS